MRIWLKGLLERFLGRRKKSSFKLTRITRLIDSPESAAKFFRKIWDKDLLTKQEQIYVVFVDEQNYYIDHKLLHTGGVCSTVLDLRVLFSIALENKADGIFLAHNHPKGNLKPSGVDISMTREVQALGFKLGVNLWDHVILTAKGYYSFAESDMLD